MTSFAADRARRTTQVDRWLAELLGAEVERLVVEAKRLGLDQEDVIEAVKEHWARFNQGARRTIVK